MGLGDEHIDMLKSCDRCKVRGFVVEGKKRCLSVSQCYTSGRARVSREGTGNAMDFAEDGG